MRYRVDTKYGYASFDEKDEAKARAFYEDCGFCLRLCKDLFDEEGEVLEGVAHLPEWVEA